MSAVASTNETPRSPRNFSYYLFADSISDIIFIENDKGAIEVTIAFFLPGIPRSILLEFSVTREEYDRTDVVLSDLSETNDLTLVAINHLFPDQDLLKKIQTNPLHEEM